MSVLVDTSVIVAALNLRDRKRSGARRLLADILRGKYGTPFVTDYIVDETLTFLASRSAEAARRAGALFFEKPVFRILPVSIDVFNAAWVLFQRHLPVLSFTDATTVEAAKAYGVDYIATLDEPLARLYPSLTA